MLEPQTYILSEDEVWKLVKKAVKNRDAFVARALLDLLAD